MRTDSLQKKDILTLVMGLVFLVGAMVLPTPKDLSRDGLIMIGILLMAAYVLDHGACSSCRDRAHGDGPPDPSHR